MPRRRTPRSFTHEEKVRLVTEIERRYRQGEGSLRTIAASLGATDANYYNWLRAGIRPRAVGQLPAMRPVEVTALVPVTSTAVAVPAPTPTPPAEAAERLTLVAPGGYRLEGLGIESAAALLKALAC